MTEVEEQQLRELGEDLAGAQQSPWEPGTIARAWATPAANALALTMQGWIDLSAIRSPILLGEAPSGREEILQTARAFGLNYAETLSGAEAAHLVNALLRAVDEAFAAALPMRPEQPTVGSNADADGFGTWMLISAALITQCGLEPFAALALRVDQAFTLLAAHRRNQGWEVAGVSYALKDAEGRGSKDQGGDAAGPSTLDPRPSSSPGGPE